MADLGYLNEQDLTPDCETEIITKTIKTKILIFQINYIVNKI